ncbi:MAG: cell wall metabolism sensor histidine kinase WalK, partial [Defluviitaleaceae bacterium]|nr:cell wall metabolism sensor histidine kinase WalK [Defluviitaleaceae bacterium]
MRSLKLKLVLMYIILIFIVMIVSGTFILVRLKDSEVSNAKRQLADRADYISGQYVKGDSTPSDIQNSFKAEKSLSLGDTQVYVLDAARQNQVIAPTDYVKMSFLDSSIAAAVSGKTGYSVGKRAADVNGSMKEWITCAVPVMDTASPGKVKYIIYTRMDATDMNNSLSQITATIFLMALIAIVMTGIMGFIFATTLTGPIASLTKR